MLSDSIYENIIHCRSTPRLTDKLLVTFLYFNISVSAGAKWTFRLSQTFPKQVEMSAKLLKHLTRMSDRVNTHVGPFVSWQSSPGTINKSGTISSEQMLRSSRVIQASWLPPYHFSALNLPVASRLASRLCYYS